MIYYIQNYTIEKITDEFNQLKVHCNKIIQDDNMPINLRVNAATLISCVIQLDATDYGKDKWSITDTRCRSDVILYVGALKSYKKGEFYKHAMEIHKLINVIDQILKLHINVPTMILCVARAFHYISRVIQEEITISFKDLRLIKSILCALLNFTLAFLEHDVDIIRYISRDILSNVITIIHDFKFQYLLNRIYNIIKRNYLPVSLKCLILQQITAIVGVNNITNNCTFLFTEIFSQHLGKDAVVNNLFQGKAISSLFMSTI